MGLKGIFGATCALARRSSAVAAAGGVLIAAVANVPPQRSFAQRPQSLPDPHPPQPWDASPLALGKLRQPSETSIAIKALKAVAHFTRAHPIMDVFTDHEGRQLAIVVNNDPLENEFLREAASRRYDWGQAGASFTGATILRACFRIIPCPADRRMIGRLFDPPELEVIRDAMRKGWLAVDGGTAATGAVAGVDAAAGEAVMAAQAR